MDDIKKQRFLVIDVERAGVLQDRAPVVDVEHSELRGSEPVSAGQIRLLAAMSACFRFHPMTGADPWQSDTQGYSTFWAKDLSGVARSFPVMVVGPLADGDL